MTSLHPPPRAVVLLSGLDSATCLAIARDMGFETYALSVAYGQRHAAELAASKRVAQASARATAPPASNSASSGLGAHRPGIAVAARSGQHRHPGDLRAGAQHGHAVDRTRLGRVLGADDIFVGVNAVDYSGYPIAGRSSSEAFEHMARLATRSASRRADCASTPR